MYVLPILSRQLVPVWGYWLSLDSMRNVWRKGYDILQMWLVTKVEQFPRTDTEAAKKTRQWNGWNTSLSENLTMLDFEQEEFVCVSLTKCSVGEKKCFVMWGLQTWKCLIPIRWFLTNVSLSVGNDSELSQFLIRQKDLSCIYKMETKRKIYSRDWRGVDY